MFLRSVTRRCNLTSLTNSYNSAKELSKWGSDRSPAKGVLRIPREDMKPISTLHESKQIIVAGRNRCNKFLSNQFMIASKTTREAILIDASDDWMDDWAMFFNSSGLTLKYCFLTHCHIDNIINLNPLMQLIPDTKIAWCSADQYWVKEFPRACERYHRFEMKNAPLPMARHRPQDLRLTMASDRSTSFLALGNTLLFHISTPGHSPGHMVLSVPQEKLLFSGDLIFDEGIGRVDLPYGNGAHLAQSLRMLEDIPDNTVILPGHGRLTTMGKERKKNRGLQRVYEMMKVGRQEPSVGFNYGYF
ncbi:beta lactamase-like protein, putative [Bodo saltans]|uniref:Beta lactamase-like protein, putative n=1 Tax=Bodo saltans TaxID=75058 RepID=A0A0S4IRF9_BODSA|nr:beta lactamase-like protein, putative [Bodo saltans]|eukprot:CUF36752.1 beta lactamase-like protein, putative [Bodo saltans]